MSDTKPTYDKVVDTLRELHDSANEVLKYYGKYHSIMTRALYADTIEAQKILEQTESAHD